MCVLGGLAEEVDEKVLHAAFIPFGDITDIQIPLDYETGNNNNSNNKHRHSSQWDISICVGTVSNPSCYDYHY